MKKLDKDLKNKKFENVYLFYGEEAYLIKQYREKFYNSIIPKGNDTFNYSFFEGKSVEVSSISDACETLPFMNDKRLIVAKDTELFIQGRKDSSDDMAKYIPDMSDSCVLIFIEKKVDKRNRLYKEVSKKGYCTEFKQMAEKELLIFVKSIFKAEKIEIDTSSALYFIRCVGTDMNTLKKEADKLFAYKKGKDKISIKDIDLICTKSLEAEIFNLVAAIGTKNPDKAIEIYNNLLIMKESPLMILSMIARQFRMILQCKYLLKNRLSNEEISSAIGIRSFMTREFVKQSSNFTNKVLLSAIRDCLNCDINIKTGKIGDKLGIELIIVKYASEI